jgi:C4-dicarboxylate transporter DctQ subunit
VSDVGQRRLAPDEAILALLLFVMVALNFSGIVARYWIRVSLPWIEEVTVGLFVWTVFLGAGLTVVRGIHIGFPALAERFSGPVRLELAVLARTLFTIFFAILTWFGTTVLLNQIANNQRTPTLAWPEWIFDAAIPVGSALAVVRIVVDALQRRKAT